MCTETGVYKKNRDENENFFGSLTDSTDVNGFEADSVMLLAVESCETENDVKTIHDMMGHDKTIHMTLDTT